MSFSQDDITKVAHLARIAISDEQSNHLSDDIRSILELIDKMKAVDTVNIIPLAHPLEATQPLRDDEITETNQRERFQAIAPNVHSGLYIVPKVLDGQ